MMCSGFLGAMLFLTLASLPYLIYVRLDTHVISTPRETDQLISAFQNQMKRRLGSLDTILRFAH